MLNVDFSSIGNRVGRSRLSLLARPVRRTSGIFPLHRSVHKNGAATLFSAVAPFFSYIFLLSQQMLLQILDLMDNIDEEILSRNSHSL